MAINMKTGQRRDLLGVLVEFLNLDIHRLDPGDIKKVASVADRRAAPNIKPSIVLCFLLRPEADYLDTQRRLLSLQRELTDDILGVLKPQPIPQGQFVPWSGISDVGFHLVKLVQKINKMQLAAGRALVPRAQLRKDIHPFATPLEVRMPRQWRPKVGRRRGMSYGRRRKEAFAVVETRIDKSAREGLYRIIDGALRAGTFFQLRHCPGCGTFCLKSDGREDYCSAGCRRSHTYQKRVLSGYFRNKMRESRRRKTVSTPARKSTNTIKHNKTAQIFERFLKKACGNASSTQSVGHIAKTMGNGDSLRGWKKINPWISRYKRGESPVSIWRGLKPQERDLFRTSAQ